MKTFKIDDDIRVFGTIVHTFPDGIGEVFDEIVKRLPGGFDRSFFGICLMTADGIKYIAAAQEKHEGEGRLYGYNNYVIEKGNYATEEIKNWRSKTDSIKHIFDEMYKSRQDADIMKPCVEWYQNDDVMWCMIRLHSENTIAK
jgi:hypothetical protein